MSRSLPDLARQYFAAANTHDVVALVSGGFPGSPVRLTFQFRLTADHITGLHTQ